MPTPIDPDLPTQGPEAPCCLVIFGERGDGPLLLAAAMAVSEVLAAFGQGGIGAADGLVLRFAPTDAEMDVCLRLCAEAGMSQPRVLTGEAAAVWWAVHAVETLVPTYGSPAALGQLARSMWDRFLLVRPPSPEDAVPERRPVWEMSATASNLKGARAAIELGSLLHSRS